MVASTGNVGKGAQFQVGTGSGPVVYTAVANVRSINLSGRTSDEQDFTHLMSSGGYREFRQGFKDAGTLTLDLHFDPTNASHTKILDDFNTGRVFPWKIDLSQIKTGWAFSLAGTGYIQNPGDLTFDVDNPIGGSVTVRLTGETTLAANA